ncbi:hypothetical protein BS47DRAFT_1369652 [Hydnum rufescens UP504]|uniref:Uncharacterized protein n=1 Tax=Hydnum rufescens UP504 TaxID=1448309 RepID=A0A9P6ACN4_9AGAM|nr:hypothetical protein BS47DRAFT_1369652 [Hydnum rufescens UP504]
MTQQQQQRQPQHMIMTTHLLQSKPKKMTGCPMSGPGQTKPQQMKLGQMKPPNKGMRGGDTNHTPAAVGVWFNIMLSPEPPAKREAEIQNLGMGTHNARPQGPRQTTHLLRQIVKHNGDPLNEPPMEMKMGPANDDHPNKTSDKTTHPPKWDLRPHQTNTGEQQPTHQMKPTNSNQKHDTSARQTTHPLWRVPSLHENPHMDEPQVRAATQAQSACPLNTMINEIAYHTPTVAATHNPQLNPRAQRLNTHKYTMMDEIPHTCCDGCVVIAGGGPWGPLGDFMA